MPAPAMRPEGDGGLGPYTPQGYVELDMDEFRRDYPTETANLSDETIWHVVSHTDDGMTPDEWRATFMEASA